MIRYSWSGWRLSQSNNRITGWWMAEINSRYFASMVSSVTGAREPFEYSKSDEFNTSYCFYLEDFHARSSSFLMGGPTEHDLNIAFEPEKTRAREALERFMAIAWLKPSAADLLKEKEYAQTKYGAYSEPAPSLDPSVVKLIKDQMSNAMKQLFEPTSFMDLQKK